MEIVSTSETLGNFYESKPHSKQKCHLRTRRRENLKSNYPRMFLEILREKNESFNQAKHFEVEIWTQDLPNSKQAYYSRCCNVRKGVLIQIFSAVVMEYGFRLRNKIVVDRKTEIWTRIIQSERRDVFSANANAAVQMRKAANLTLWLIYCHEGAWEARR
jgi:hypothetical protein